MSGVTSADRDMHHLDHHLDGVVEQLRAAGAQFAFVYGSQVAGGSTSASDTDVAAWFGSTCDELKLRSRLPADVDLLVLDQAPLELAGRVATGGRLLFDDAPPARVEWQATTRKIYLDEQPRIDRSRRDFAAAHIAVVDAERLSRLLRRVTDDLLRLRAHAADGVEPENEIVLDRIKYRLVTAIEACIDAAHHVCASEGFRTPDSNADAMRELVRHEVLHRELGESLAAAVGLRNVLVHRYADVDDRLVVEHLGRLDALDAYVQALVDRYL